LRKSHVEAPADKQTKIWNNYMKNPLPVGGNGAGAVAAGAAGLNQVTGGLAMGSVSASAVTSAFNFLTYTM
jgi:POT family proton-dependent oligopeptide transporter